MTTRKCLISLALVLNVCAVLPAQEAAALLSSAVYEEEVNGDLIIAVHLYKRVASEFPGDRPQVAEALLRLGIAHEKLGDRAAQTYYEQLIKNFQDQEDYVQQARDRLNRLTRKSAVPKYQTPPRNASMIRINTIFSRSGSPRSISTDGRYFAFADPGKGNLCLHDRVQDEVIKLTPDSLFDSQTDKWTKGVSTSSVWSADSERIAYYWFRHGGGSDLRVYDLSTKESFVVCPSSFEYTPIPLDWSTDGTRILCDIMDRQRGERVLVFINSETCSVDTVKVFTGRSAVRGGMWASVSADNRWVLYQAQDDEGRYDVHLASMDGLVDRMIHGWPMTNERYPVWLNDQSGFLFMSNFTGMNGLWKATLDMDLNIQETSLLVEGVGAIHSPLGMTSDDTYYYMSRVSTSHAYETLVNFHELSLGPDRLIVSSGGEGRGSPVLSPDGTKLAYYRTRTAIEIQDMASGTERQLPVKLPDGMSFCYAPFRWTPDGNHLYVVILAQQITEAGALDPVRTFNVIQIDASSGEHEILVDNGDYPAFSPDQQTLYFRRNQQLYVKDMRSGNEEMIYKSDRRLYFSAVSPDAKYLAFFEGPADKNFVYDRLVLMMLADRSTEILWETPGNQRFLDRINWLHNSKQLMLTTGHRGKTDAQLYLCDIETGEMLELGERTHAEEERRFFYALGPDGRTIFFHRRRSMANVWSIENY